MATNEMQKLFHKNCVLNNVDIRLSCHQKNQSNSSLAFITKNSQITIYHFYYENAEPDIICVPWLIQDDKQIEAICFNPTSDWLLIITEDSSLHVVPTLRSAEKENQIDLKWSPSDITHITNKSPCTNSKKPVKLLWWQRKNLNQNALIGYEDGTIRLVALENGECLDTCKVDDQIRSLLLGSRDNSYGTPLLILGEGGKKWRAILKRQLISAIWEGRTNSRKAIHFQSLEVVNDDIPEFSLFKCCMICAISEDSKSVIGRFSESSFNIGELDLNVDILQTHFDFSENENVLQVYKIMDNDYFNDKNYDEVSNGLQIIFPNLIENIKLSKPPVEGYLVVTEIGIYKISLTSFVVDKVIGLAMNNKVEVAKRLTLCFGLNFAQLLGSCGDLLIVHDAIRDGLQMYENAKVDPLKRIDQIKSNNELFLKFCQLYLATNKSKMEIKSKIYVNNLIVMTYVQMIFEQDKKYEKDLLDFIRDEEFYDANSIFVVICHVNLWHVAFSLAIIHGFQCELVAALSEAVASSPPLNDTNFLMVLSDSSLTQSLLVQPKSFTTILRYVRKNLKNFPLVILERFANQLDFSKNFNVFETTVQDQIDHRREMTETFIFIVMQIIKQKNSVPCSNNINLLQKLNPLKEVSDNPSLQNVCNFSKLSCGYKFAAVVRNDKLYTMGSSTSGSLGIGATEKENNQPKLVQTLDDLNVIVWSVSCGRKHTLVLTDCGVFSWGSNAYGQLGISSLNRKSLYPALVTSLRNEQIVDVVAGQYHSMALTASGLVYTWGWGIHGQLGHGITNNECIPRLLNFNNSIVKIAAGYAHSLILTSEGKVYGFGSNAYGQLAKENLYGNKSSVPIQIFFLCNMFIPYRDIAAGYFQSVVIRKEYDSLFIWGTTPNYARLNRSKSTQTSNKPLKLWKSPMRPYYKLSEKIQIKKVVVGLDHIVMLHHGVLYMCKDMEESFTRVEINEQNNSGKFTSVSCGLDFTLARSKTGRLFFWGDNMIAKTLMGKLHDKANKVIEPSDSFQSDLESPPVEILGLPSIIITYHPMVHSFKLAKSIYQTSKFVYKFEEQETLIRIIEAYFGYYDTQDIINKCLEMNNLLAASKVAILNNQFEDSFRYQLQTIEFCSDKIEKETTSLKILENLVEFNIEYSLSSECESYIKNVTNMCIEFWANNDLPVSNLEEILLKNVDKLSDTLFNLLFCEHSNNYHTEANENEDDDNKLRNRKVSQFLKSFSNNLKLQLCSLIVQSISTENKDENIYF